MSGPEVESDEDVRPVALGTGLVVELDRQFVRAVMFGSVEGQGRLLATSTVQSTSLPPIDDTSVAVKQAIREIEEQTGIFILGDGGVQVPVDGETGVDYFAVTGQPIAPSRLTIVPLGESAVSTALIAAANRSVAVVDVLGAKVRTGDGVIAGALFEQSLRAFRPDTVVLIEGNTAMTEWTTAIGTLVAMVNDGVVGQVIIIAGEHYQQQAAQAFGEKADLRGIDPSEFAPTDIAAALETELQALYDSRLSPQNTVTSTRPLRFVSSVRAGDLVTRFLARRRDEAITMLSAGDGSIVHWATSDQSETRVLPEFDAFTGIRGVLSLEIDAIARWLPFAASHEDISHWVLNRALRPFTVAESPRDLAFESAVLTAALRDLWGSCSASAEARAEVLIGGRPWSHSQSSALAVFTLLNIIQPAPRSGMVEVVIDTDGLAAAAGAIGEQSPAIAADVVELDLIVPAASVVVVTGAGSEGDLAVRGQMRYQNGDVTRFTVPFGSMHRLSLPPGQEGTLALTCEPRFAIGTGTGSDDVVFGRTTPLRGSELGIIIDARGRPVQTAGDPGLRATRVATWLEDLGFRI